jgi:hypothetical protein
MDISNKQLQYRKRIGHIGSKAVFELATKGGLKVVAVQEASGKLKTLGAGSHRSIARWLAQKTEPSLEIDALEKSEGFQYNDFKDLLPLWEAVTARLAAHVK